MYLSKDLWEYIPNSIPSVCTTIFKWIAGLHFYPKSLMFYINGFVWKTEIFQKNSEALIWSNCNVLYINGFASTSSTNQVFSTFQVTFRNFGPKPKNIQKNSEAWISIKLQCVVHQWIRLNEHYKLIKCFFSNSKLIFEILAENGKFWLETEKYSKE